MKYAIITGATSGIGKSIKKLLSVKYKVIDISRKGNISVDLSKRTNLEKFCKLFKFPDNCSILINNAGKLVIPENKMNWNELMNLNLYAPFLLTSKFFETNNGGIVVNIASVSGHVAEPEIPIYAMTKSALISMTKSFAKLGGEKNPKIRVVSISPGVIKTNLVPDEVPDFILEKIVLGREGLPMEVAKLVMEIINNEYITGVDFLIDGGLTL